jgi:V-type H+-transporting ATPase subunit C
LSTKSLVGIVSKEDVVVDSEYLETLLVAVPKYVARSPRIKNLSLSLFEYRYVAMC